MRYWPAPISVLFFILQIMVVGLEGKNERSVYVVCTAALIPRGYEERRNQYEESLKKIKSFGYEPYVIESCAVGPTFLDTLSKNVCYTKSNNPNFSNKGINEAIALRVGLEYFSFSPESMIIKLTGRYTLATNEFIELVKNNPQADVVARVWNARDVYTGIFAMRCKYLIDFLNNEIGDFNFLEKNHVALEWRLGEYIEKLRGKGAKIVHLPRVYSYLPVAMPFHRGVLSL